MKKITIILLESILVLGIFAAGFTPVFAKSSGFSPSSSNSGPSDPVVTPRNEGMAYTSSILPISWLPGSYLSSSQRLLPIGKDGQFNGSGVKVSDVQRGDSVTVCFDFPFYDYNWGGNVFKWDGSQWIKQPTTITDGQEGANNWACMSGAGNGIYALLIYNL